MSSSVFPWTHSLHITDENRRIQDLSRSPSLRAEKDQESSQSDDRQRSGSRSLSSPASCLEGRRTSLEVARPCKSLTSALEREEEDPLTQLERSRRVENITAHDINLPPPPHYYCVAKYK